MKICHISVKNFRGIKELEWDIERDINCLIGPGDATKSTILAAIYYAFYPTWNPVLRDSDFYNQDVSQPIEIIVTMKDIPLELRQRLDKYRRGLKDGKIVDEPLDGSIPVWSIKLLVTESLEPSWTVYTERQFPFFPSISVSERRSLSVFRLGGVFDTDFSWTKGSVLTRMSDQGSTLRTALRALRATNNYDPESQLSTVAGNVQTSASTIGVTPIDMFKPGIDTQSLEDNRGILSLHDGEVPLRMKGKGTKRLIAMAMQRKLTNQKGILTIDEIETGLEPYRLRHLIRALRDGYTDGQISQVFATTHSDIAVVEFSIKELSIVFCNQKTGVVTIKNVPNDPDLQKLLRSHNEAVLGKKIIVCEGKTECGLLTGLDQHWCSNNGKYFSLFGVVPTDLTNGVDEAAAVALKVKSLGYESALFIDGDVQPGRISVQEIEAAGVKVFQWDGTYCTEQVIFRDIDAASFTSLLRIASEIRTEQTFVQDLSNEIQAAGLVSQAPTASDIFSLPITLELRAIVGKVANVKSWYKDRDRAAKVGRVVAASLPNISETNLSKQITEMITWAEG